MKIPYLLTLDGLQIFDNGQIYNVSKTDSQFENILNAVRIGDSQAIHRCLTLIQRKLTNIHELSPRMKYAHGVVYYDGEPMGGYSVEKLIAFIHEGLDFVPLANFIEKVQSNPTKTVIDELYQFLEHGKIPLTQNGNFLVYKAVRQDYKDCHSGTFNNSVGQVVSVPRSKVDPNRNQTCSYGLHVCSFDYLPHFAHGSRIVICEVNPAHVVAIPPDYNNTKMRVQQYSVLGELEGYTGDKKKDDILAATAVVTDSYTVWGRMDDSNEWTELEQHNDYAQAKKDAENELKFYWDMVRVTNRRDESLYEACE